MTNPPARSLLVACVAVLALATVACGGGDATNQASEQELTQGREGVFVVKHDVEAGDVRQAAQQIESRLQALGAQTLQVDGIGDRVVIDIPAASGDPTRSLQVAGTPGQLLFRPVIQPLPADAATTPKTTPREEDRPEATVVLPEQDRNGKVVRRYQLGPAELNGGAISSARANLDDNGQWLVEFRLTAAGSSAFDALAMDLDGVVKSPPTIQQAQFNGRGQITGAFSQRDAKDLAMVLGSGSLPVECELQVVQQFHRRSWGTHGGRRSIGSRATTLELPLPDALTSQPFEVTVSAVHERLARSGFTELDIDRLGDALRVQLFGSGAARVDAAKQALISDELADVPSAEIVVAAAEVL